ncbi:hypothetical protein D9758_007633 [Tetrapyrgos nigripes]|uniref:Uncharacterized protein n=1 Tax=Tetrapyrgos nigripes TaxID=182062 RepID=A0A8H5G7V5_9AGAR|nr:hypothetical protein D9758_007633 [Tetrapyrgos nigripes]
MHYPSTSRNPPTAHVHQRPDPEEPPAKRRRGLAGSIVSTALSAALIGTAVGLTVYRLWRDRGKEQLISSNTNGDAAGAGAGAGAGTGTGAPPPPYSTSPTDPSHRLPNVNVLNATPRRRPHGHGHTHSISASGKRKQRGRTYQYGIPSTSSGPEPGPGHSSSSSTASASASNSFFPPTQPQFDFSFGGNGNGFGFGQQGQGHGQASTGTTKTPGTSQDDDDPPLEDQMDWIGSKLSSLIAEGRKALGREVVVMSETKEDEEGDSEGWVDEDPVDSSSGSVRGRGGGRGPATGVDSDGTDYWDQSSSYTSARSASPRRRKRKVHTPTGSISRPPPSYPSYPSPPASVPSSVPSSAGYSNTSFGFGAGPSAPSTPTAIGRDDNSSNTSNSKGGLGLGLGSVTVFGGQGGFESPELRESMEKARARVKERMGMGGSMRG